MLPARRRQLDGKNPLVVLQTNPEVVAKSLARHVAGASTRDQELSAWLIEQAAAAVSSAIKTLLLYMPIPDDAISDAFLTVWQLILEQLTIAANRTLAERVEEALSKQDPALQSQLVIKAHDWYSQVIKIIPSIAMSLALGIIGIGSPKPLNALAKAYFLGGAPYADERGVSAVPKALPPEEEEEEGSV